MQQRPAQQHRRCVGKWQHRLAAVALAAVAGLFVRAAAAAPSQQALQLVMTDYRFEPHSLSLHSGRSQRIVLVNRGTQPHELMIGRGAHSGGGHHGFMENFFEGLQISVESGGVTLEARDLTHVVLQPGASVTLTLTVPPNRKGQWELGCFVPGHYELGMKGTLTVR